MTYLRGCTAQLLTRVLLSFPGRLTQLIALTGSSGSWRKTIIDRAIAYASLASCTPAVH